MLMEPPGPAGTAPSRLFLILPEKVLARGRPLLVRAFSFLIAHENFLFVYMYMVWRDI